MKSLKIKERRIKITLQEKKKATFINGGCLMSKATKEAHESEMRN